MITIVSRISKRAAIGAFIFFALMLAVIFGGVALALRNHALEIEFQNKARVLDNLDRQRINPANIQKSASLPVEVMAISAPTETVAASQLQHLIVSTLDGVGASVHSIQAEATTDTIGDGLRRLKAQIDFDSSTASLQKLLFNFETAIPYIFVDGIAIQPLPTAANGAISGDAILRITLVASSYWKDFANQTHNH
jgi:hypothetical protein